VDLDLSVVLDTSLESKGTRVKQFLPALQLVGLNLRSER
jgi:hypothetical protein